MISANKIILRIILVLSYVLLLASITFGISAVYSYLNTGADRSKMLHKGIIKNTHYIPKIVWDLSLNKGRFVDPEIMQAIETDYLNAWYVKHIAYKTNNAQGIEDYYTKNARKSIFNSIKANTSKGIFIDGTTLEHHLAVEFLSEDGQLAVLTDTNVEYKHIYKNKNFIFESVEKNTYKIILLLEDQFWRIRHSIKNASLKPKVIKSSNIKNIPYMGINYYPKATPWDMYGDDFDIMTIRHDFKIIKEAKLNTIRIFVPYEDFGKASINKEKLTKLIQVLDAAEAQDLNVLVTLFDFYGDYSVIDWTITQKHAEVMVSALKDHKAIIGWDVKNEPDLDFESRGKHQVTAWLKKTIQIIQSIDNKHPVTIGWAKPESAPILKNQVDFISFHYYKDIDNFENTLHQLKIKIPNKQIVVSEFGISSYNGFWKPFGSSQSKQAEYHKKMQHILKTNNIAGFSWTLYDFTKIPENVVGTLPWRRNLQKKYGFIDHNGQKKEAFQYISN